MNCRTLLSPLIEDGEPGEVEVIGEASINSRYPIVGPGGWILDLTGKGYGGDMKILASYKEDGTIMDIVLMDNAETPGLGKKAEKSEYMDKYRSTGGKSPCSCNKRYAWSRGGCRQRCHHNFCRYWAGSC